jgi:CAAD domains of cyanobacterial aminoacyl-tRNA synthetase
MNPEGKKDTVVPDLVTEEIKQVNIETEESGVLAPFSSTLQSSNEQWQSVLGKISAILADLPEYVSSFFSEYKRPLTAAGLVLGSFVAVKLTLAILGSINDVPLLSPSLELIGLGYTAWFVYRYLLRASSRSELANDFNELKAQVLGKDAHKD